MALEVIELCEHDELQPVIAAIDAAQWDEGNEVDLGDYTEESLRTYLQHQDTIFIVCYLSENGSDTLAGMASGRINPRPYGIEKWLYIDEVDTCRNLRQRGVGKTMMRRLLEIARKKDCEEVWLGTEVDNFPANRLYQSLDPDDIGSVNGYTFELD